MLATTFTLLLASTPLLSIAKPMGAHHAPPSILAAFSHSNLANALPETVSMYTLETRSDGYYGDERGWPAPSELQSKRAITLPPGWSVNGCVTEGISGRALTGTSYTNKNLVTADCLNYCSSKGFTIAGTEYGQECYCGNSLSNGGGIKADQCNVPCAGSSDICGGGWFLSTYTFNSACSTTSNTAPIAAISSSSSSVSVSKSAVATSISTGLPAAVTTSISAPPTTIPSAPTTTAAGPVAAGTQIAGASTEWEDLGCFVDNPTLASSMGLHILTGSKVTGRQDMTREVCQTMCDAQGYNFAGVEYGQECYCGDLTTSTLASLTSASWCTIPCTGNSGQNCGGGWAMELFELVELC